MSVYYMKKVEIPEFDEMIIAVLNSCKFYLQRYDKTLTKHYVLKNYIEYRIGLNDYSNDDDFRDLIKRNYSTSNRVRLKNGRFILVSDEGNPTGLTLSEVSNITHNGMIYKETREADYSIPESEGITILTSREESLEFVKSKIGEKSYKIFVMDTKYINKFWDEYPDGLISINLGTNRKELIDLD